MMIDAETISLVIEATLTRKIRTTQLQNATWLEMYVAELTYWIKLWVECISRAISRFARLPAPPLAIIARDRGKMAGYKQGTDGGILSFLAFQDASSCSVRA